MYTGSNKLYSNANYNLTTFIHIELQMFINSNINNIPTNNFNCITYDNTKKFYTNKIDLLKGKIDLPEFSPLLKCNYGSCFQNLNKILNKLNSDSNYDTTLKHFIVTPDEVGAIVLKNIKRYYRGLNMYMDTWFSYDEKSVKEDIYTYDFKLGICKFETSLCSVNIYPKNDTDNKLILFYISYRTIIYTSTNNRYNNRMFNIPIMITKNISITNFGLYSNFVPCGALTYKVFDRSITDNLGDSHRGFISGYTFIGDLVTDIWPLNEIYEVKKEQVNRQKIVNMIKSMDHNYTIGGPVSVNQFIHNSMIITLFGELHDNSDVEIKQKCFNNSNYTISFVQYLWNILKGTQKCIDFAYEDYTKKSVVIEKNKLKIPLYGSWNMDKYDPLIGQLNNIRQMTKQDTYMYEQYSKRHYYKLFRHSRVHRVDYRIWDNFAPSFTFGFITSPINDKFYPSLSVNISNEIYTKMKLFNRLTNEYNLREALFLYRDIFIYILTLNPNFKIETTKEIIEKKIRQLMMPLYNFFGTNFYTTNQKNLAGEINFLVTFTYVSRKSINKLSSENEYNKYKDFFATMIEVYLEYGNKSFINPYLKNHWNFLIHQITSRFTSLFMDSYFILRILKTFGQPSQNNNLHSKSLCYDKLSLNNRNIILYAGNYHTQTYVLFFAYYTNKIPKYSISDDNVPKIMRSVKMFPANSDDSYSITKEDLKEMQRKYIKQHMMLSISFPPEAAAYTNPNHVYSNNKCLKNTNNILKNITMNITQHTLLSGGNKFKLVS